MSIAASSNLRDHVVRLYFVPVLGPIIASRSLCIGVLSICVMQTASLLTHFTLWKCPMLQVTGIPCPGCGLSRAMGSLVKRDFATMADQHVLAPGFFLAVVLCCIAAVLPERFRRAIAEYVTHIESRLPVITVFLSITILYWIARLVLRHHPDLA